MYKWKHASRSLLGRDTGLFVKHAEHEEEEKALEEGEVESIIIASEPLYRAEEAWNLVPPNHVLTVTPKNDVILEPIDLSTISEEKLHLNNPITSVIIARPPRLPVREISFDNNSNSAKEKVNEKEREDIHIDAEPPSISVSSITAEEDELEIEKSLAERKRTRHHAQASLSLLVREHAGSPHPGEDQAMKEAHEKGRGFCLVVPEEQELAHDTALRVRTRHRTPSGLSEVIHQQLQHLHHDESAREKGVATISPAEVVEKVESVVVEGKLQQQITNQLSSKREESSRVWDGEKTIMIQLNFSELVALFGLGIILLLGLALILD